MTKNFCDKCAQEITPENAPVLKEISLRIGSGELKISVHHA